jgi:hypothetical protein
MRGGRRCHRARIHPESPHQDETTVDLSITAINISLPSATSAVDGTDSTSGPHRRPFRAAMDAAASALGMQPQDLFSALRSGQSLADLAKSKGLSQDQLVSAMSSAITEANPQISSDQATQIATRIATRVPGQDGGPSSARGGVSGAGGHHGHHHHGADLLNAAAGALGEDSSSLLSALQGGQSIADVGAANGVSQDSLVNAVVAALQKENPNLSTDQAKQFATDFVTAGGQSGTQVNLTAEARSSVPAPFRPAGRRRLETWRGRPSLSRTGAAPCSRVRARGLSGSRRRLRAPRS